MSLFVTVEGGDGVGKTTLVTGLADAHPEALVLREPGGTGVGDAVRALVLDARSSITPASEALLFAAARAQLVAEVVRPALAAGKLVICDRYVESSIAYQGAGRELGCDLVSRLNVVATGGLVADLVIVLDVPLDIARNRRGSADDRMEATGDEFARRVRAAYLELARGEPDRIAVIDAARPPGEVLSEALALIATRL